MDCKSNPMRLLCDQEAEVAMEDMVEMVTIVDLEMVCGCPFFLFVTDRKWKRNIW